MYIPTGGLLYMSGVPQGVIVMWSGTTDNIPDGWALCNGSNGTPNLVNRFIVGAGSTYNPGNTGGSDTVALSTDQMPSHNHTFSSGAAASNGAHTHTVTGSTSSTSAGEATISLYSVYVQNGNSVGGGQANGSRRGSATVQLGDHSHSITSGSATSSGAHTHTVTGTIGNNGSGTAHENRPPYYALCFIIKL